LQAFQREVFEFEKSQSRISKTYKSQNKYFHAQPISISLAPFDPNRADSMSFLRLGLKPFMAKMILNYRRKGGRFKKPDDFAKVPFLSKEQFETLRPYIRIDESQIAKRDTFASKSPVFIRQEKYAEGTLVDLATADTTELKKIPGIASGTAKAIIGYRSRLGGFYSINQLKELKSMSDEQFAKIGKFLRLSDIKINRISVNRSGFEHLRAHPYLNFYQVKAIVELRKKRGKINSLSELSLLEEFSQQDFDRLKHYLDFSQ
jgi:competence ComEA-like helix-hairpin-helix protein